MKCKRTLLAVAASLALSPALAASVPATATLGNGTGGIATDPVLRKVFVTNYQSGSVSAVDIDTMAVQTLAVADYPRRIVSNAATHRLYLLHDLSPGQMTVLDEKDGSLVAEIPLGNRPLVFAADFPHGEIYVANQDSNTLSIVNVASNAVVDTLALGVSPTGVDLDSLRGKIYVTSASDASVTVIDQKSRSVEARVAVGSDPGTPVVDERTGKVYVNNKRDNTVSVLDPHDEAVQATIPVGAGSTWGAVSAIYHRYYLPNAASGTVSIVDTDSGQRLADVPVGASPEQVAVDAGDGDFYVINKVSGTVTVADAATDSVSETFPVGTNPWRIALAMDRVLVLNENGAALDSLSVLEQKGAQKDTAIATEYYHSDFIHYFNSADPIETRLLADGILGDAWQRSMQFFRVWTTPGEGRFPVCRFFGTGFGEKSSHYFTPYPATCDAMKSDPAWNFEGVSYYLALPDAAGTCPSGTEPLYGLFNNESGGAPNHRLTSDRTTRDRMAIGAWIAEGNGPDFVFACTPPLREVVSETRVADVEPPVGDVQRPAPIWVKPLPIVATPVVEAQSPPVWVKPKPTAAVRDTVPL